MGDKTTINKSIQTLARYFLQPSSSKINNLNNVVANIKTMLFEHLKLEATPALYETKSSLSLFYRLWTYVVSIKVGDEILLSSGEANSKQIALIKCLFEYLERLSFIVLKTSDLSLVPVKFDKTLSDNISVHSSNGFAAHTSFEQASLSAILELLERDTFLYYWFSKTEPIAITDIYTKDFLIFDRYYQRHDITMSLFEMPSYESLVTFVIIYEIRQCDIRLFSFSSHFNKEIALRKALFEGFRYMQRLIEQGNYISEHYVEELDIKPPIEHHYFYYMNSKRKNAFDFM